MAQILPLSNTACQVTVQALLDVAENTSPTLQRHLLWRLRTNSYTAVSHALMLRIVREYPQKLTNDMLAALTPPHVKELSLGKCSQISPYGIHRLLKRCQRLQKLDIRNCDQLMLPGFFPMLSQLSSHLNSLILAECDGVNSQLVQVVLKHLPNLHHLDISGCHQVTDSAFLVYEDLQKGIGKHGYFLNGDRQTYLCQLGSVNMAGCRVTRDAIYHLTTLCGPHLQALNITNTKIDCFALWLLCGFSLCTVARLAHMWNGLELLCATRFVGFQMVEDLLSSMSILLHSDLGAEQPSDCLDGEVKNTENKLSRLNDLCSEKIESEKIESVFPGWSQLQNLPVISSLEHQCFCLGNAHAANSGTNVCSTGGANQGLHACSSSPDCTIMPRTRNSLDCKSLTCVAQSTDEHVSHVTSSVSDESASDKTCDNEDRCLNKPVQPAVRCKCCKSNGQPACNGEGMTDEVNVASPLGKMPFRCNNVVQLYQPNLRSLEMLGLEFHNMPLGQQCLKDLVRYNPGLTKLRIYWRGLTDDTLGFIANHAPGLRNVALIECVQLSSPGLHCLSSICRNLQHLDLEGVAFISDATVIPLLTLLQLKNLSLLATKITDESLKIIATKCNHQLESLDLSWCEEVTAEGLNTIAQSCSSLRKLSLKDTPAEESTLLTLSEHCTNLQDLKVSDLGPAVTDVVLCSWAVRLKNLTRLDLGWDTDLTDVGVSAVVTHLIHLEHLVLAGLFRISSAPFMPIISGLKQWRRCQGLLRLKLWEQEKLNTLGEQLSSDEEYEDLCLPHRSTCYAPNLRFLNLVCCHQVNEYHIAEVVAVCRGTLIATNTDVNGQPLLPNWVCCRNGLVFETNPHEIYAKPEEE